MCGTSQRAPQVTQLGQVEGRVSRRVGIGNDLEKRSTLYIVWKNDRREDQWKDSSLVAYLLSRSHKARGIHFTRTLEEYYVIIKSSMSTCEIRG